MINGVTILCENQPRNIPIWIIILTAIVAMAFAYFMIFFSLRDNGDFGLIFIFPFIFSLILTFGLITLHNAKTQYVCMISNEASITEVYEKYNVIKQKEAMWVLEDKEDNNDRQ